MTPICIELFAGLHGWGEGFVAEEYRVIGFDIVDVCAAVCQHRPTGCQLVLQDVLTLHGSQFRDAAVIVASPPCQEYSYMAMPWSRAKQIAAGLRGLGDFPERYRGSRTVEQLNALFGACFRIQREASEAAGRHIPLIVENVKGAQPWVGRAAWSFGSYYLWGDVPALMPPAKTLKVPGFNFHQHEKTGKPGGSFQSAAVTQKQPVWFNDDKRRSQKCGGDWFSSGADCSLMRRMSSKSTARKAASAQIAKIPFALANHIARVFDPRRQEARAC